MKKIERPDWAKMVRENSNGSMNLFRFDGWFDEHIEPFNKAIDGGEVVYGKNAIGIENPNWTVEKYDCATHKALLMGIEPIKQETCADVLEAIMDDITWNKSPTKRKEMFRRIKAALEREK